MPFGQPYPAGIRYQRTMIKPRRLPPERAIKQQLSRRRPQQIFTTHNFTDPHPRIIDHHRQLVRWHFVMTPYHKIPKVPPCDILLRSAAAVFEPDHLTVSNTKSPTPPPGRFLGRTVVHVAPAGAWIYWLIIPGVRRLRRSQNILPRTSARIHMTARH
jgi:hypothetical protein